MAFLMPPEWAPQDWLWVGFPHDAHEWPGVLEPAQEQIAAFASAVAESGQQVRLLVRDAENSARAKQLVSNLVTVEQRKFGDIWLRDTGPLTVLDGDGNREARCFRFNGWGGKFLMDGDQTIGEELAIDAGLRTHRPEFVLEGGAIDTNGAGMCVTTEQCLLNPNRNPGIGREQIEAELAHDLGFEQVLWLAEGLKGDHTDGHIDNLARFVSPNEIAMPVPSGHDDPNARTYADASARVADFGLTIREIPSPGLVTFGGGAEPASYMNFVITNRLVVVPIFGTKWDDEAVMAIAECFPDHDTIGLPADVILAGGGGFHCASQQMPSA